MSMAVDLVRFFHLVGLALGFGLAIYADARCMRSLQRPTGAADLAALRQIHGFVAAALIVLWVSGLTLLALRTGFDPAAISDKLRVKLCLATLLTVNAVMSGRVALPMMERAGGLAFAALPLQSRCLLAMIGGASAASWAGLMALGVFGVFKTMAFVEIAALLSLGFVVSFTGALTLAVLAPYLQAGMGGVFRLLPAALFAAAPLHRRRDEQCATSQG